MAAFRLISFISDDLSDAISDPNGGVKMPKRRAESGQTRTVLPLIVVAVFVAAAMLLTHLARRKTPAKPDMKDGASKGAGEKQPGAGKEEPPPPPPPVAPGLKLAELFGPDVLAFAWCPDIQKAEEDLKKTPLYLIGTDPEVRDFVKDIGNRNPKQRAEYENSIPYGRMLRRVFTRDVALAVLDVEPDDDLAHAVAVGALAKGDNSVELLMDLLRRDLKAEGTMEKVAYGTVEYELFTKKGTNETLCFARLPELMAVSSTEKALRTLLDRIKEPKPGDSLATSERFGEVAKRLGTSADLSIYVNAEKFFDAVVTDDTGRENLRKTGLDVIRAAGVASRMGPAGVVDRVVVMAPGERRGLMALFDPKLSRPKSVALLPADTVLALSYELDPKRLWNELRGPLAEAGLTDRADMDRFAEEIEKATGLRFTEDILEVMEGEVAVSLYLAPIGMHPSFTAVVEVTDVKRAKRVMSALAATAALRTGLERGSMTVGETEVNYFKGTNNAFVPSPCYAFRGRRLILSSATFVMKQMIQAEADETLVSTKAYRRFGQIIPAERPLAIFVDVPRLAALGYDRLQNELIRLKGFFLDFDAARLPPVGLIRRYMSPGGITLTQDKEAIRIDMASPFGLGSLVAAGAMAAYIQESLARTPARRPGARSAPKRNPLNPWPRGRGGDREEF